MIEFDLREMLRGVMDQARADTGRRDVLIDCRVAPEVPPRLGGAEAQLRQALLLLLGRAASLTPGMVALTVGVEESREDRISLRFEVTDQACSGRPDGSGDLPKLADAMPEGDMDLALWSQHARRLADDLGIVSDHDNGTTCWFTVGFDVRALGQPVHVDRGARTGRVLIVEDNLVNQRVASRLLEKFGFIADVVENGREALDAIDREAYGLILMDCQMPVMDGYEATVEIRRREGVRRHTPIVALTALAVESNRERCLDSGMDDFVTKPISPAELRRVLDEWMDPDGSTAP